MPGKDQHESTELATKIIAEKFVAQIFLVKQTNKQDSSRLQYAASKNRQFMAWPAFVNLGYSVAEPTTTAIMSCIASAIINSPFGNNGTNNIATAYAKTCKNKSSELRFNRLLSCDTAMELCEVLNPLIKVIHSKNEQIDLIKLTKDLIYFEHDRQRVRVQWIENFYRNYSVPTENQKDKD